MISREHGPPFAISAPDETWLVASGEVDMATAPLLQHTIESAEAAAPPLLIIDLSGVTFIDVSGLRVLLLAARRAREEGRRVVLAEPSRMIRRLLALTAIDQSAEVWCGAAAQPANGLPERG